jgi:hypothetical protein
MQTHATKKRAVGDRGERFDIRDPNVPQLRKRPRNVIGVLRPPTIRRFCPDWHSLRTWEDDGGGQTKLR